MKHKQIDCSIKPIKDNLENNAQFIQSIVCINETTDDITLVMRDNLPMTYTRVPNTGASCSQLFTIRKIYKFRTHSTIQETMNNLYLLIGHEKDQLLPNDLYYVYQILMEQLKINPCVANYDIHINRTLSLKEIHEMGCCYLSDLDIALYRGRYSPNMLHPYSTKARSLESFKDFKTMRLTSGILMEIVSDENSLTSRYVSLGGKIMKLPNSLDDERPEGLYVTRVEDNKLTTEFCKLDEMQDKFNVYPTKEEALTAGQPDILIKTQLKELEKQVEIAKREGQKESLELKQASEQQLAELKLKHEREKSELDLQAQRDKAEHERSLNKMKQEHEEFMAELKRANAQQKQELDERIHKLEEKRQEMKDHYEERSHVRKDNSELIKYIPALILAGVGIYGIASKGK